VRRLGVLLAAVLTAALVVAGCGGGSSSGGGGEPASLAPKGAPVFIEANLTPSGKLSEELDELTQKVFGIENVGEFIAEEFEKGVLNSGQKLNFEEEVEPWLGEKIGLYLKEYDGAHFSGAGIALATSNAGEAEEFLEKRTEVDEEEGEEIEEGEFEGAKYWVSPEEESVLGVVGDYVAFGESLADFEEMVETEQGGEGLNESPTFEKAMEGAEADGLGIVYVDIGGLIGEAKGSIDAETEAGFALLGIEPRDATAVATVVPHSEQIELDLSTDVTKATSPGGDASALLESLPATAVAGFALPEFGQTFGERVHEFSEQGVPGQLEPGELEAAFESLGIKLESLSSSIGNAAGFVEGTSMANLGGAAVIETDNAGEAKNTVAKIGLLLRATHTAGVTAIGGELSGFSVHSSSIGSQPLIVGAAGERIVISYGPRAAAQALRKQAKTLGSTADFEAAKGTLGSTPMSAFIDGGPGLKLVEGLLSPEERVQIGKARPYLQKISYVAIGSEVKGAATTAKVIVGLRK
jgi:Protein of unknown function (DUF3352)